MRYTYASTLNYYLDHLNFAITNHTADNGLDKDLEAIEIHLYKPNRDLMSLFASFSHSVR